jgi:hypothetical protein
MVSPGRFELPTYGLGNRCSIQLSYGDPAVYVNSLGEDRLPLPREIRACYPDAARRDVHPASPSPSKRLVLQHRMDVLPGQLRPAAEKL